MVLFLDSSEIVQQLMSDFKWMRMTRMVMRLRRPYDDSEGL
jgi:hypothetical protein